MQDKIHKVREFVTMKFLIPCKITSIHWKKGNNETYFFK